ncbi:poly(A) polymerase [Streptomyces sp. NPDC089799]|uniref:poly(A) polymerase n=1 Tax=Streptomyces sp. NPDC089799 TaxID=3155066 RepID=UPI0034188FDC
MRTSEEIYHQVRWDPRFDPARFVLGLHQRGAEPKRVPLPSFVPGGEIPWHRVLFVEADGQLVWDRASGLDVVGRSDAGRVREPLRLPAPFFTARTPYAFDPAAGQWAPAPAPSASSPAASASASGARSLRVLTWNTLWDRYDADRIDTAARRPRLLAALAAADADVIALQEVEPDLLDMLLAADWVRAGYTLGTHPAGADVADSGVLLLSRLPVKEAGGHRLGPHKAVAAIAVETGGGPVVVAAAHLSSDHSEDGAGRRAAELARLAEGLGAVGTELVLVGDFNDGREGPEGPAGRLGMRDAWTETHGPADRTPTFDPAVNPLAAVSSLTGRAARLDRILLRGTARVAGAGLLGDVPDRDGLFVSDHYGVRADLSLDATGPVPAAGTEGTGGTEVLDVPGTARTALAWLPPAGVWPAVQELRRAYDPQVDRWPPHVSLLFGFVPESEFDRAVPLVSAVAAAADGFPVRWAGVHTFGHREDATVWLDPTGAGEAPWQELRAALAARFPRCRGRAPGFTPHLSLGRTPDWQRAAADCAERLAGLPPARAGELVLLSRRGTEPMRVRARVALGTGEVRWTPEAATDAVAATDAAEYVDATEVVDATDGAHTGDGAHITDGTDGAHIGDVTDPVDGPGEAEALLVDTVTARVAAALGDGAVEVAGSRRMGCSLPGADLDLVAALPGAADSGSAGARIAAALPEADRLRQVRGARVPGLRFAVGGLAVDLVLVGTGAVDPARALADRAGLGEAAAVALSALSDADAVRAAVAGRAPAFERLARRVKGWARVRGLDSAPHGGLPGLAWSVLAARTVLETDPATHGEGEALLREFFARWAAWDWRRPVVLTGTPRTGAPGPGTPYPDAPVTVLTPTPPVRSCTAQVGPGFRDLLVQELYQAWEALENGSPGELSAPPPLHRRHAAWAVVTVRAAGPAEHDELLGRVRGRTRALLTALEEAGVPDAHAWPRPYRTGPVSSRFAIGLGRTPPTESALTALAAAWSGDLRGVDVSRVAGGDLPSLR